MRPAEWEVKQVETEALEGRGSHKEIAGCAVGILIHHRTTIGGLDIRCQFGAIINYFPVVVSRQCPVWHHLLGILGTRCQRRGTASWDSLGTVRVESRWGGVDTRATLLPNHGQREPEFSTDRVQYPTRAKHSLTPHRQVRNLVAECTVLVLVHSSG